MTTTVWHGALQAIGAVMALQAIQIPPPRGYVNDFANVISAESEARLTRIIEDVRAKSGGEIVVVTLPDIGEGEGSDVALRIGREWKVGQQGRPGDRARNAGIIILLVPRETQSVGGGHFRIETGQGTEGFITDGEAGDIYREVFAYFQESGTGQEQYSRALELATTRVADHFAREFGFALDTALVPRPAPVQRAPRGGGGFPPQLFYILFILLMFFLSSLGGGRRRGRRRSGCGGGGCLPIILPFPGGFGGGYHRGGFGGGGFGGGFGGGGFGGGFGGFGGGGGFSGGGGGGRF
jgi:uncharacterized protein